MKETNNSIYISKEPSEMGDSENVENLDLLYLGHKHYRKAWEEGK